MRQKLSKISQNRKNLHKKWAQIIVYGFSKNNKLKKNIEFRTGPFLFAQKTFRIYVSNFSIDFRNRNF